MRTFVIWLLVFMPVLAGGQAYTLTFDTIAAMTNTPPNAIASGTSKKVTATVRGYGSQGDNGGGAYFYNALATNAVDGGYYLATTSTGRWERVDKDSMTARSWGVKGDGVTDDTVRIQDALWAIGDRLQTNQIGNVDAGDFGTLVLPQGTVYKITDTLTLPYGVSIVAANDGSASKGFPEDRASPRIVAGPNFGHNAMLHLGEYVRNGVTNRSRFSTLKGFILDGDYDNQDTNALWQTGILVDDQQCKNFVIEGLAIVNTVGYGFFARAGIGSSQIRDCYFGSGVFLSVSSDLKFMDCDIAGRTRGSTTGTPFPPLWTTRYTWKNTYSRIFMFSGPRKETGYGNSIKKFEISSYDDAADTITLATTNGLYDGMPLTWYCGAVTNYPSGVTPPEVYFAVWGGSGNDIQLRSTSDILLNFTGGTNTGDALYMGDEDAPLMLIAGDSQNNFSRFDDFRLEDNGGDLIVLRGSDANVYSGFVADFAYTNTSRFLRLKHGADQNLFTGSFFAWTSSANQGYAAPETIIEFDSTSNNNAFRGVKITGNTGVRVIDNSLDVPANSFDTLAQSEQLSIRGDNPTIRFEDLDIGKTNVLSGSNENLMFATDQTGATEDNYLWRFDGLTGQMTVVGEESDDAPGLFVIGYSNSPPQITMLRTTGGRTNITGTSVSSLGSIFFAGHDSNAVTSARGGMIGYAPTVWNTTNHNTEIYFEVTPQNSTSRVETVRFESDGTITHTDDAPVYAAVPTNGTSGLRFTVPSTHSTNTLFRWQHGSSTMFQLDKTAYPNAGISTWISNALRRISVTNINGAAVLYAEGFAGPGTGGGGTGGAGATNGTSVFVDAAGPYVSLNLGDSAEIAVDVTGSTNAAHSLVDGSISTNRIDANFHSLLLAGGGGGSDVKVDAGSTLATADFTSTDIITFGETGGSVTATVANASIGTNKLTAAALASLLNRTNHVGTQNWNTLFSTPTTLGGYGITDAQYTNATLTRLAGIGAGVSGDILYRDATGWTNLAKGSDTQVLTLASGLPSWAAATGGSAGTNFGSLMQVVGGFDVKFNTPVLDSEILVTNAMFGIVTGLTVTDGDSVTPIFLTVTLSNYFTTTNYGVFMTAEGNTADALPVMTIEEGQQHTNECRLLISGAWNAAAPDQRVIIWFVDYNASANVVGNGTISDTAFASALNGQTTVAPSQNVLYDWGHLFDTDDDGKVNVVDIASGFALADSGGALTAVSATGSGNVMRTRTGVIREIWIPANAMGGGTSDAPTASTNVWATTTDGQRAETWDFSATSTNSVYWTLTLPQAWDAGTVKAKVHFKQVTAEATSTNVWAFGGGSLNSGETGGNTLGTLVNLTTVGANDTNVLTITAATSAVTIGGSPAAGHMTWFTLKRLPGHADDNSSVLERLFGVHLQYTETTTEPSAW